LTYNLYKVYLIFYLKLISLKFIPFEIPVPNAFEKASFAANLLA
jgi:hypothetical protein